MTKEELLKRLHEILEIVGPDRAFEISENTNERKTLWIHQTPGEDEYLMLSATKLFPISTIRNIVYALCFLPWWVSFLIVLVLTVMAALLLPSRHSVCWARMLSTFCLLPVMIKSLGFELLAVSLPTAILNIGFCLLLSYLTAPVLLELIFVSYLYQK